MTANRIHIAFMWVGGSQPTAHTLSYTFSAKERDPETGLSYFGSRYYSSDLSIWLSVDPMSAKYPSLSPYVYCANNPVKLVDPNGEEIVIRGEDGDFTFTPGSECSSSDWKVKKAWENLNHMYSKKAGKTVINEMIKENSPSFVFTDESLYSDGTGRFRKDDKGGGTMYMGGQLESVSELAHELFHGYQEVKGQGGPSIHNEVEAFLFAGLFSDKMSNGLFVKSGGNNQEYIQAVSNLLFGEKYDNFDHDFENLIKGFKSQSSANYRKKYQNMDLYRGDQKEDLFKLLVK